MTDITLTRSRPATELPALLPIVGRVLIAAVFFLSGLAKLGDPAGTLAYIDSAGLPLPAAALAVAVAVELLGSVLLVIGYKVRLVAAGLALFTVIAGLAFHFDLSDQNQFVHFFKNLALAGGLLQVVAFGSRAKTDH